jgi:hypothetical protein
VLRTYLVHNELDQCYGHSKALQASPSCTYFYVFDARSEDSATGLLQATVAVSIRPHVLFGLHSIPTSLSFRHLLPFLSLSFHQSVEEFYTYFIHDQTSFSFSFMTVIFRIRHTSRSSVRYKVICQENKYKSTLPLNSSLYFSFALQHEGC